MAEQRLSEGQDTSCRLRDKYQDCLTATPPLAKLYEDITPQYAADWKVIGTSLGIPEGELKAIEAGYPTNTKWCCNQMLEKWLEMDSTASWDKICTAVESPAVSGADAVSTVSNYMVTFYERQRFTIQEETWPLASQPTTYIPQTLVYHHGRYNAKKESDLMVQLITSGHNQLIESAKVTKDITEIFPALDTGKFILIEGSPGMGKSILLKEIAYAKKQLLKSIKFIFLINLQDPKVHQIESLSGLLQYCYEENCWPKSTVTCEDHISGDNGKDVAFLFDAFDEFPATLWKNSFVYKIVKRKILPNCTLVVSSCQHASACLRQEATVRVYLLGFTEMEQKKQFIEQILKDQTQNIRELSEYIERDTTISELCSVPYNIAVLLFLYNQEILFSSNSVELYNQFICISICRYLAKHGYSLQNRIYDLTNLPAPCNKIIMQLCKLSMENLESEKTFTLDEIKETCPDIVTTPGAMNGLGLLQAVQRNCLTGNTIEFSFIHSSIQAFLAAHHIRMLDNQLKCLQFFNFFFERDKKEICRDITNAKTFQDRAISLRGKRLSSSDVKCLTCFLTESAHQEWEELDLHGCDIRDCGIDILHQGLINHNITIKRISLSNNNLTELSSPKIYDIVIHCRVEVLAARFNPSIGKNPMLYAAISDPNSMLKELYMSHTNCRRSNTATELFSALEKNKKLKTLRISNNNITDDACDSIVKALKYNNSLVELIMFGNPISKRIAVQTVKALAHNNTVEYLAIPYDSKNQKRIRKVAKNIDKKRDCRLHIELFCHKPSVH